MLFGLAFLFLTGFVAAAAWLFREPLGALVDRFAPEESSVEISSVVADEPGAAADRSPPEPSPSPAQPGGPAPDSTVAAADPAPLPSPAGNRTLDPTEPLAPIPADLGPKPRIEPGAGGTLALSPDAAPVRSGAVPPAPSRAGDLVEVPPKPVMAGTNEGPGSEVSASGLGSLPPVKLPDNLSPEDEEAARAAGRDLIRFLKAGSLKERLKYTLASEQMQPLMERYYAAHPDGPVAVDSISLVRLDRRPQLGSGTHAVFGVDSREWEYPIPVMLEAAKDEFRIDWLSFVEFKDRLLEKFFQGYQEGKAAFHVGITRQHYFGDDIPSGSDKEAFRVSTAPPNPFLTPVFLDRSSDLARDLKDKEKIPWGAQVWAIVELEWVKAGTQQWVELAAVPQLNWYSVPAGPPAAESAGARAGAGAKAPGSGGAAAAPTPAPTPPKAVPAENAPAPKRALPVGR